MTESKRKRDASNGDVHERKTKEKRLHIRQEELEKEFTATYHSLTALYKLLEVQHLRSPLFLPRTLSYRLVRPIKSDKTKDEKEAKLIERKPKMKSIIATAMLHEFKIGMTSDTIETFKRENKRIGLQFSLYTATKKCFQDNIFELKATCLIPVPCVKAITLPSSLLCKCTDIVSIVVHMVQINDVMEDLSSATCYTFQPVTQPLSVKGCDLLKTSINQRVPLFGNLMRLNVDQCKKMVCSMELPSIGLLVLGTVKLQFRVSWDPSDHHKQHMERLQQVIHSKWAPNFINKTGDVISDELMIPKHSVGTSPWSRRGHTNVWFHYLYHSMLRRMSEKRPDFSCAWCNMYAGSLRGLVMHLVSSHGRFRFHVVAGHDNIPHIYVMPRQVKTQGSRNKESSCSGGVNAHPLLCELNSNDDYDMDRIEQPFMYLSSRKCRDKNGSTEDPLMGRMDEFDELEGSGEEPPQEFFAPLMQRQYFHSRTGAVVLETEKDYDSDNDVDEEWITQQSERLLDEFEDVSLEEKEFMKKWNRHVKENRILADFMVASSCRLFAKRHGKWLVEAGLRYNFLLHLFNLWDNSLLNARGLIDCMLIVDHVAVEQEIQEKEGTNDVKDSNPSNEISVS